MNELVSPRNHGADMKWFRATSFLVGLGLVLSVTGVTGQEKAAKKEDKVEKKDVKDDKKDAKDDKAEKKDEPAKAKDAKEPAAKSKGQLPQNWSQLGLTDLQKQGIYKLQGKFNEESDKLELQIKEMKAKMSEERSKILTADQKKRLEEILKAKAGTAK